MTGLPTPLAVPRKIRLAFSKPSVKALTRQLPLYEASNATSPATVGTPMQLPYPAMPATTPSTTPAFSPGPCSTRFPFVGRCLRNRRLDLYEQCSLHMAEKIPSSTRLGSRPRALWMRAYSSCERPCAATICGVMAAMGRATYQTAPDPGGDSAGRERLQFSPAGVRITRSMSQGRIEQERLRFEEAERRQRLLSDVSRLLLDYVGP